MILITGAAGYIGSHTAITLINSNYKVLILDNLENGHIEIINQLKKFKNIIFEKADLRKLEEVERIFSTYKIDAVIHFAAFALVSESIENPSKYYRNNVFGTLNLIDTMVKHNVKKLVFSSSCAIYGEPQYTPIDENHPQNPINPYGKSKLMVEKILEDYDDAYELKSIKLRYFNVVGADELTRTGEWHEPETHLLPNILKSYKLNKPFKIYGDTFNTPDGTCIRDYVNVEDLADAHKLALNYLEKEHTSDVFNLGTERGQSVKKVVKICENILNQKINVEIVAKRLGDPSKLYANSTKAKSILGWAPSRTLETSIQSAYNWENTLKNN